MTNAPQNFLDKHFYPLLKKIFNPALGVLFRHSPKPLEIPQSYYQSKSLNKSLSFTIVTPSFNQANFVEKTIRSVLDQQYSPLEYVVQDGGSTDNSAEVIQKYESNLTRWESKKDKGQADAINLGFKNTHGEIMAYLNSDDIFLPGALNYVAWYFENHPDVDAVYSHRVLIDQHDQEVGRWVLPPHDSETLKWIDYVPQETLFWRRSLWDKAGGMIDENRQFALDWDLLIRFQQAGAKMVRLPRFLGAFRVHESQKTHTEFNSVGLEEMQLVRLKSLGYRPEKNEVRKHARKYAVKHVIYDKLYQAGILRY